MADEAIKNGVLDILADLTGSDDVKTNLDLNLFETGLLDSMGVCPETVPDSRFEMYITPIMEECALSRHPKVLTSV